MSIPPSPVVVPRNAIRRNHSTPAVHTITSITDISSDQSDICSNSPRDLGRVSMDSFDRARCIRPSAVNTKILSSSAPDFSPSVSRSGHKKSSSSPSNLLSPQLMPGSTASSSITDLPALGLIPVIVESEVEPLALPQSQLPHSSFGDAGTVSSLFSFGRSRAGSISSTPAATPPPSPALNAASTRASTRGPSPSTTPPSSPSPSFFARLPSIPRPSPMLPFRAAKKVVTSVTSVGSGLLPSKEQLGSIPVAGRILKHPVMDSTLTYIASKTTHRGGRDTQSKAVSPEDVHYRKLNRRLVDQSITLAALAMEKEELSKTIDDEAGDDAFELYLASIATLMHALPIETCDPLRREAFESQLRNFLQENEHHVVKGDMDSKQLRRFRRRRHRLHREQASLLIHEHSSALSSNDSKTSHFQDPLPPLSSSSSLSKSSKARKKECQPRRGRGRRQREPSGANNSRPTFGDTIISTAVESAIRLKQSPIPDVIRTCFQASRTILYKVDERFHLQEKAWQLSKQSIEKAIELDEQYAIHELVTETFFATVTGLVKAGIAYKETPSYASSKALTIQQQEQQQQANEPQRHMQESLASTAGTVRLQNPQAIIRNKKTRRSSASRRRYSVIKEENEEDFRMGKDEVEQEDMGSEEYDAEESLSSSCFTTSTSEDGSSSDSQDGANVPSAAEMRRGTWLSTATASLPGPYKEQIEQKIGVFMVLRGAASLLARSVGSK
ncbi:hypothetical protein BGX28_005457 [Mortierella sp. GBA30]|nr:hypothetical protein BGX28_005457 [Mortierella sp. GBA30]